MKKFNEWCSNRKIVESIMPMSDEEMEKAGPGYYGHPDHAEWKAEQEKRAAQKRQDAAQERQDAMQQLPDSIKYEIENLINGTKKLSQLNQSLRASIAARIVNSLGVNVSELPPA